MKYLVLQFSCLILFFWIVNIEGLDIYFKHGDVDMVYHRQDKGARAEREEYVCECKCYSKVLKDGWDCCECPWTESVCFPGDVTLTLENDKQIKMRKLKPMDRVLTVTSEGKKVFSEVRTFLKRLPDKMAVYLDVVTMDNQMISLSESHVIFSSSSNTTSYTSTFAGKLKIGDYIYTTRNCNKQLCPIQIKHIHKNVRQGAYVPLTEEGTVLVNNVLASCYSSIDHNLAHVALTPIRRFPWLLGDYQGEGYSPFIHALKMIGHWILPDSLQYDMTLVHHASVHKIEL